MGGSAWGFHVGGIRVCEKWLEDRRHRQLTYDELTHYGKLVAVAATTVDIMDRIERDFPNWPLPGS